MRPRNTRNRPPRPAGVTSDPLRPAQSVHDRTGQIIGSQHPQAGQLRGDALVFVPQAVQIAVTTATTISPDQHPAAIPQTARRPHPRRGRRAAHTTPPRLHRSQPPPHMGQILHTKSEAHDLATRIHEDIARNLYECPICTNDIHRRSKVWSCNICWTVFHLGCVKKWSTNEGSTLIRTGTQDCIDPPRREWRCPGCNLPKQEVPESYTCWCGKEDDPHPIPGIPPHSCGQTCSRLRSTDKCPHPCKSLCHAGPCPTCELMGPTKTCFCGKESTSKKCRETDYESAWSCGRRCYHHMPCQDHVCERLCHEGACGKCQTVMSLRCYCGQTSENLPCHARGRIQKSSLRSPSASLETWDGAFRCSKKCNRPFDCGKHACEKNCHSHDATDTQCPWSTKTLHNCQCGKTLIRDIAGASRASCDDAIPACDKTCGKRLRCGHECTNICHTGSCPPCFEQIIISCRCGRTSSDSMCHQDVIQQPQCGKSCRATLNCGRHGCGERCCPSERAALQRQATRRKLKPLSTAESLASNIEAEHICTRTCNRPLKCGNHDCPELCHKGACNTCHEALFDDLSCHCGRTVLQAPLPCGTKTPDCHFQCQRSRDCGHSQAQHECHADEQKCPICPFLCRKICLCGKKTLNNQPCFLKDVRCGQACSAPLSCGIHLCRQQCHRPGQCEDSAKACEQICGKPKPQCKHPCRDRCHGSAECEEATACQYRTMITCACQNLKQEVKCGASKSNDGSVKRTLDCDDECARLMRNRELAIALNIDVENREDSLLSYSADTLKLFQKYLPWSEAQEAQIRAFASNEEEKCLRFKPMAPHHRHFLHLLARDYGLDSESVDPGPHRHIAMFKTPRFVCAPAKSLRQSQQLSQLQQTEPYSSSVHAEAELITKSDEASTKPFYNAILLEKVHFGLTEEDLSSAITPLLPNPLPLRYTFLPDDTIAIQPPDTDPDTPSPLSLSTLNGLIRGLLASASQNPLAQESQLCQLSSDPGLAQGLRVELRESDAVAESTYTRTTIAPSAAGWSTVVAGTNAKRAQAMRLAVEQKANQTPRHGRYTVLGSTGGKKGMVQKGVGLMKPESAKEAGGLREGASSADASSEAVALDHLDSTSGLTDDAYTNPSQPEKPSTPVHDKLLAATNTNNAEQETIGFDWADDMTASDGGAALLDKPQGFVNRLH